MLGYTMKFIAKNEVEVKPGANKGESLFHSNSFNISGHFLEAELCSLLFANAVWKQVEHFLLGGDGLCSIQHG